jgi:hypothetical protein
MVTTTANPEPEHIRIYKALDLDNKVGKMVKKYL